MPLIGDRLGYRILRSIARREPTHMSGAAYAGRSKIEVLLGPDIWSQIAGKTVIDFGCGSGADTLELARHGAQHAYGVDINERCLEIARRHAAAEGYRNVSFSTTPAEPADIIVSLDAFEHFADPASILAVMANMLKPEGCVLAAFGPTWYHPLGGHLFSVFPWAHLIFSETALCRWRSHLRSDGAQRFSEVEGGLNRMTIGRFEKLVEHSPFCFDFLETVPIRRARGLHCRPTREFLTAVVRCRLRPRVSLILSRAT